MRPVERRIVYVARTVWRRGIAPRFRIDDAVCPSRLCPVNPPFPDPPTSPRSTGDDTNIELWDPLQRTNPDS